jgi:histidine triad (HIT) family protein
MTIFEKIINGELEGSFVYRDEICAAFMDINPINVGHILVVPNVAYKRLSDLPLDVGGHLFQIAQKIVKAIEASELKCEGINLFLSDGEIAGQEVPHIHLHIVPRFLDDGIKLSFGKKYLKVGRDDLNRTAKKIAASIYLLNSQND